MVRTNLPRILPILFVTQGVAQAQIQATATPVVESGFITGVSIANPGQGYQTPPLVTIQDATGAAALGIARIRDGRVTSISMRQAGASYVNPTVTLSPPPGPDLNLGLVSYFRMNGTGKDSVNENISASISGATLTPDRLGNPAFAFSFDGVDDFMQAPDTPLPKGSAPRTICCFYKVNRFPLPDQHEQLLISYGLSQQVGRAFFMTHEYTSRKLAWSQWGNAVVWDDDPLTPHVWRFAAVTYDNPSAALYVDGLKKAQGSFTIDTGSTGKVSFGRMEGAAGSIRRFNGSLDDVRVYNRALPAAEVALLHDVMSTDSDSDSVTDFDELVLLHTNTHLQDTDGDGYLDGVEVLYNADPSAASSRPDFVAAYPAIEIEFVSALGKSYQLQSSDDLLAWGDVGTPVPGNGGVITKFLPTRGNQKRFWRYVELP